MNAPFGLPSAAIGNPHGVDTDLDRILPVRHDIPNYSETAFLSSWSPESGVGVLVHVGRCPQDVELWYAQTLVYLPDGLIAVDRTWGRTRDPRRVETGSFMLDMGEAIGAWSSEFDGAAELYTAAQMARRPAGAGSARPMRWRFDCRPAGPVYNLYAGRLDREGWAQGTHTQQILHLNGWIRVDGTEYCLDGYASNDHSSGPRKLDRFGSHSWLIGGFPGSALHCISVFDLDGTPLLQAGSEFTTGNEARLRLEEVPKLSCLDRHPAEVTAVLAMSTGERIPVRLETLHFLPLSLGRGNDNVNGIEWDGPDLLVLTEARVRMTRLDTREVGYAHFERSRQRSEILSTRP